MSFTSRTTHNAPRRFVLEVFFLLCMLELCVCVCVLFRVLVAASQACQLEWFVLICA